MVRLHLVVEGQTEETFAGAVLRPSLADVGVYVDARSVQTSRKGTTVHRGGMGRGSTYQRLRRDITRWMKQDQGRDAWFSTMVDLYGLPTDFPGYEESRTQRDPLDRVRVIEERLCLDIGHPRLVPYVQLHEFEAILFSGPEQFAVSFPDCQKQIDGLCAIAARFATPEHINDDEHGAPSKRVARELPGYLGRKTTVGPRIAQAMGLDGIREKCQHFREWLQKLEALGQSS